MTRESASTRPDPARETVHGSDGRVIGEILENDGAWLVVRREPVRFPPRRRHTLLATFPSLDEARARAPALLGVAGDGSARPV